MNLNFSSVLLKHACLNAQKLFHNSSVNLACHYETLKLKKNCSSKEIRDSFLKLSKENHPDISKHPNAHKEFLKIQEAYSVLSKPESRACYDLGLSTPGYRVKYENPNASYSYGRSSGPRSGPRYTTHGRNPWDDTSFYHNRDRSQDAFYENKPYYGIRGIPKQSNGRVAFAVIIFTMIMFVLQMFAISRTYSVQQDIMNKRSMATQQLLNEIQARAERNGNQVQIEIHRKQFEEMERLRAEQIAQMK